MVQYLHFRILEFPLISSRGCVAAKVLHIGQGMSAGRDANHLVSCGIASGSPYESNESYTTLIWYIPSYKYIHIYIYIYNTYIFFLTYELGMHMQVVAMIGLNPEPPMLYHLLHLVAKRMCQWQSMSQWPTHIMWILQWLTTDLPSMTIKTGSHIQHLLCWFWIFRFKHFYFEFILHQQISIE